MGANTSPGTTVGEFRLYPRGFLGAAMGAQVAPILRPMEDRIKHHQFHTDMFKPARAPVEVNVNIEQLYRKRLNNESHLATFEFREKLLIIALNTFGTSDFCYWFRTQHVSPATGDLHRRFLDDTLRFILTGRREMFLETWNTLLTLSDIDGNITPLSTYAKEFFCMDSNTASSPPKQNIKLREVIQQWVSRPNGFEDLLGSLHILFGNTTI